MSLEVLETGPLSTVQDGGRLGLRGFGVSEAGPVDRTAFQMANRLVGNAPDAAAIEFAYVGGRFRVTRAATLAVTGPGASVSIDGQPAKAQATLRLEPGQELRIGALSKGLWGYLAIGGGVDTPPVLGSRATHLRFSLGGLEGRTLRAGDCLPLGDGPEIANHVATRALPDVTAAPIRVLLGPQDNFFAPDVLERFLSQEHRVSARIDRMAAQIDGAPLPAVRGHDIVSDGTVPGAIQVPGSGQPLVLLVEGQTSGGYPKIATVIGADLTRLAQLGPGKPFQFQAVTPEEAEAALLAMHQETRAILDAIQEVQDYRPDPQKLMGENLISGVWHPNMDQDVS